VTVAKPFPRGRFVWYDLMTTDPDAAIAFYRKAFAWGITPFPQDPTYRMWTVGKNPMGGVMRLSEEARRTGTPPNWLPYISVPNVDAAVRQAAGLGAKAHVQPRDIPDMGRFAVLADPQGAAFAVYQFPTGAQAPDAAPAAPKTGEFAWHELATTDWRAAWEFYRALFAWQKTEAMDMGPAGTYHMFGYGGPSVGGIYNKPPEMPAPAHWLCYVSVAKADDAAASVTKLGGKIVNGPMEVPGGGRIAMCLDPQGAAFAVYSTPAPATKSRAAKPKKMSKQKAKPKRRAKAAKRRA
jgi:predicted enzyme related to lactoylglutathione lyase